MTSQEIKLLQSKHNAAIIAPAGHGKTEMITELVSMFPGKILVLTHTNAGVSALEQRLERRNVPREKYVLSTISAFCIRWSNAYPCVSNIDMRLSYSDRNFYSNRYQGTSRLFGHPWARNVISATYSCIIIDEYQDCILEQHQIFLELNKTIPIYVLGDPLQSIYGWAGTLVSWRNLGFNFVDIKTHPWRWEHTNRDLGKYLVDIRNVLEPALSNKKVRMKTVSQGDYIRKISPIDARKPQFLSTLSKFRKVLYLTKWPQGQCAFSRNSGGLFQNDEPQNLNELYGFVERIDTKDTHEKVKAVFSFVEACASRVTAELSSYRNHISLGDYNFSRIKKHPALGAKILSLKQNGQYNDILSVLEYIQCRPEFNIFRKELFGEMIRSIRYAQDQNLTIYEAAQQIRMNPNYQRKSPDFKMLSSRTVLSKGLEFECVAIDLKDSFSATDMYVAMTRATKLIYFITDRDDVLLDIPKGIS